MKTFIVLLVSLFTLQPAFAQGEKFLPSVEGIGVNADYANASALDTVFAEMPSPTPARGEDVLYFNLGDSLPANTPVTINIYGRIPPGSNLLVGALVDEENEGFAHRACTQVEDIVLRYDSALSITHTWNFTVHHFCLLRICATGASVRHPDGSVTPGVSDRENGKSCFINALSYATRPKPPVVPRSWKYYYGPFVINSSMARAIRRQ